MTSADGLNGFDCSSSIIVVTLAKLAGGTMIRLADEHELVAFCPERNPRGAHPSSADLFVR
jgi:hypothetical protein